MKALVEMGAKVDEADNTGITPLQAAAREGVEEVVRGLVEIGAEVNQKDDSERAALPPGSKRTND